MLTKDANSRRANRQFGPTLKPGSEHINSGIGYRLVLNSDGFVDPVHPTHTYDNTATYTVAGQWSVFSSCIWWKRWSHENDWNLSKCQKHFAFSMQNWCNNASITLQLKTLYIQKCDWTWRMVSDLQTKMPEHDWNGTKLQFSNRSSNWQNI